MRLSSAVLDLSPLRASRSFRDLWLGSSASALGGQFVTVAVLYQVWELTGSAFWTGAIGLVRAVPLIVFGLVGGTLADATDRRRIVRWTTAAQLVTASGLAAQALAQVQSLVLLLALVGAQATFGALGVPARRALPPRLLPLAQVPAGIALQHLSFQVSMLVGPALAGIVIAELGLTWAFGVQAVTFVLAWLGVLRLPHLPPDAGADRPGLAAMVAGVRLVLRRPVLRGSLATDLFATILAMPISLFPLVNEVRFGGSASTLGFFLSAVAVGGIVAGLLSGTVTRARRAGLVQLAAAGSWGLALAGFGLAEPLWLALGLLAVAGAADTISVVIRAAMVQLDTPDSHRGRVSAVESVIGQAGPDVGNFRGGVVAGLTSAPLALVSGGLACVLGVAFVGWRNRGLRDYRPPTPQLPGAGG
ncbi:MFS transporter [Ruania albidiflava]|uniref:MFS transporter n=1 Tax=Ruania albidiflava TaxID=366586 RepID=UPI0003B7BB52|nr:MFS transporter [Ruania albidiflava]